MYFVYDYVLFVGERGYGVPGTYTLKLSTVFRVCKCNHTYRIVVLLQSDALFQTLRMVLHRGIRQLGRT